MTVRIARADGRLTCPKVTYHRTIPHHCNRPAVNGAYCGLHDPKRPDKVARREKAKAKLERTAERMSELERLLRRVYVYFQPESNRRLDEEIREALGNTATGEKPGAKPPGGESP